MMSVAEMVALIDLYRAKLSLGAAKPYFVEIEEVVTPVYIN